MYIQMLKNQHVTFVYTQSEAERFSPFKVWYNEYSGCHTVSDHIKGQCVAAGLTKEEAEACVLFKANEYIARSMSK